jgi:predicted enzyme related to lactoylglutathione lyase
MTGEPTHFELGVADVGQAETFYGQLLGWRFHELGNGAWIDTGGVRGGLHPDDPTPGIVVYFEVSDLEAALRQVTELGGTPGEASPPQPGFGSFAECQDDQGARFGLHQPAVA